jgi:hypothetical protein
MEQIERLRGQRGRAYRRTPPRTLRALRLAQRAEDLRPVGIAELVFEADHADERARVRGLDRSCLC